MRNYTVITICFLTVFILTYVSIAIIHGSLTKILKNDNQYIVNSFKTNPYDTNHKSQKVLNRSIFNDILNDDNKVVEYENEIRVLKTKLKLLEQQLSLINKRNLLEYNLENSINMKPISEDLENLNDVQDRPVEVSVTSKYNALNQNIQSPITTTKTSKLHEYKSEIDIYSYSAFTLTKIFPAEMHLYKRNVELLSGPRLEDLKSVVEAGIEHLNKKNNGYNYNLSDFHIGFFRASPFDGYDYQLHFKQNSKCCSVVRLNRPIGELYAKESILMNNHHSAADDDVTQKVINFIVPLWGNRLNALRTFLNSFENIILNDNKCTLTIVYLYNNKDKHEITWKNYADNLINQFKSRTRFNAIKFHAFNSDKHSRAKALQLGIEHCCSSFKNNNNNNNNTSNNVNTYNSEDDLLFFCDTDVIFNNEFLNLCRTTPEKNNRVFYPIIYSLYNPKIVSKFSLNSTTTTTASSSLVINKDSGFWRDFGFGMVCLYKSDFMSINGFKDLTQLEGWGDEDLFLYRKYLNSNLQITRAITPGIFHIYHEKLCNKNELNQLQYTHCLESKILNEASHRHFGFLYFNYTLTQN